MGPERRTSGPPPLRVTKLPIWASDYVPLVKRMATSARVHPKVLWAVVRAPLVGVINVMHYLAGQKRAPEDPDHDKPML